MAPQQKKGGCARNLLILGGAGLILICVLMAYGGSQIGTEVAAQPTEVSTPVPTPIPTETPIDSVAATMEAAANVVVPTSAPAPTSHPRGYVSKATFGEEWPLTVDEGLMDCLKPQRVFFLSLDKQRVWAVNVLARQEIKDKGWSDVEEIHKEGVHLEPLIAVGLKLCP